MSTGFWQVGPFTYRPTLFLPRPPISDAKAFLGNDLSIWKTPSQSLGMRRLMAFERRLEYRKSWKSCIGIWNLMFACIPLARWLSDAPVRPRLWARKNVCQAIGTATAHRIPSKVNGDTIINTVDKSKSLKRKPTGVDINTYPPTQDSQRRHRVWQPEETEETNTNSL